MPTGFPLQPLDHELLELFNRPGIHLLDHVMSAASNGRVLLALLLVLTIWVGVRSPHRWFAAAMLLLATGGTDLLSARVVKPMVARVRPCRADPVHVQAPLGCGPAESFPSNHAANAAAAATIVAWAVPWSSGAVIFAAVLIGISRVYNGVHWPTDVLAGWLLGVGVGLGVIWIYRLRYVVHRRHGP